MPSAVATPKPGKEVVRSTETKPPQTKQSGAEISLSTTASEKATGSSTATATVTRSRQAQLGAGLARCN